MLCRQVGGQMKAYQWSQERVRVCTYKGVVQFSHDQGCVCICTTHCMRTPRSQDFRWTLATTVDGRLDPALNRLCLAFAPSPGTLPLISRRFCCSMSNLLEADVFVVPCRTWWRLTCSLFHVGPGGDRPFFRFRVNIVLMTMKTG
jgi:hypothetical protein